jgi:hypothetical protein
MRLVWMSTGVSHLGFAFPVVAIMAHVFGVVLLISMRALENLSSLPLIRSSGWFWFRLFIWLSVLVINLLILRHVRAFAEFIFIIEILKGRFIVGIKLIKEIFQNWLVDLILVHTRVDCLGEYVWSIGKLGFLLNLFYNSGTETFRTVWRSI